jgi:sterol 3beta-glucosyltransferase
MRALLYTFGTRGDIEPFIALARRLDQAGHRAAICTADGYRSQVEDAGIDYRHMNNDLLRLTQELMTRRGSRDAPKLLRAMGAAQRSALRDQWAAALDYQPTVIVYHPKALGGYHIAERLDVPGVLSLPLPFFTPTREFPVPFIGHWPLGKRANHASYQLQRATAVLYGGMLNDFRNQLGLAPIQRTSTLLTDHRDRPVPILYAFSRHLRPVPADYPPHAHVTGAWFLDREPGWQPSSDLSDFLAAGPPPVYIGFGSMGFGAGAEARYRAIVDTVHRAGLRAILARGWSHLTAENTDDLLVVDDVPHDWLLPQMSAVVHHGGSGTTAAGLRAGRPSLLCPVIGDQPFWGRQIHGLGAGPAPLPWRRLTSASFESRLHDLVSHSGYREVATRIKQQMATEDGTGAAVAVLESMVS